ncbi:ABC transporter permease [Hominiventricola filiformis]|uniref:ABC transporter permease subunit n=1 Tax=Hominiventricola filiformis TaxID=2885352 RepID=A0AAE3DAK4_9FIRM|nr:ABC transporter permease subunit [Hominiventricola filiformis]MCC2125225.1 ABC transporter permease subunit [Hominiventricola filiformis]
MIRKIHGALPHLLFLVLVFLILQPSVEGTKSYTAFLIIVIAVEAALLANRKKKAAIDIGIIVFAALILWEYITAKVGVKDAMLYPAPENVFNIFVTDYEKILEGVGSSLRLMGLAFALALFFGVGLGLIVGLSDRLSSTVMPIVRVISPIPPIIYSPYAVALLPSFRAASIFVITMTIFWSIFMNMVLSVRQIDRKIMDSARTLNLNQSSMILHVLLPYSLPGIINSVSVSVSTSFLVLTAAEMIGATSGLGWYIKYNADFANFTKVIAGIFVIGVVVTVLNALISLVKRLLIRWR